MGKQQSLGKKKKVKRKLPTGVVVLGIIFAALFIIPLASSSGLDETTSWEVIACLIGLVGLIFVIAKLILPWIAGLARKGLRLAQSVDQQVTAHQVSNRAMVPIVQQRRPVAPTHSASPVVVTPISQAASVMQQRAHAVAELPLPVQWEQIRKQMFFLGYDEAKAIPKTSILGSMVVIEDPAKEPHRTVAARLLLEQLLTKAEDVAIVVITTSHKFDNLVLHFDNSLYLVGGPGGVSSLPKALHQYYAEIPDEESADAFCQTLIEEGDHAIFNLYTYQKETEALKIVSNLLYSLVSYASTSTRECILVLDNAQDLLPTDIRLGKGLFSQKTLAQSFRDDVLHLLVGNKESMLHTYLLTPRPMEMDIHAIWEARFWIVNKVLTQEEIRLVQGRMLAEPDELARLMKNETLFTEETGKSPIRNVVLRPTETEHIEPLPAKATIVAKLQQGEGELPTRTLPIPSVQIQEAPHEQKLGVAPPVHEETDIQTTSSLRDSQGIVAQPSLYQVATEVEDIVPEMLEYVWYVRRYAPKYYTPKYLMYPPQDLSAFVEALKLETVLKRQGYVFPETIARAIMHRTEDLPEEGDRYAMDARIRFLAFQDKLGTVIETEIQDGEEEEEEMEEEMEEEEEDTFLIEVAKDVTHESRASHQSTLFQMPLEGSSPWKMPDTSLLDPVKVKTAQDSLADREAFALPIREALKQFKVYGDVLAEDVKIGPTVVRLGIRPTGKPKEIPDPEHPERKIPLRDASGAIEYETRTRVSRIMALQNDLALILRAKSLRMEAPVSEEQYVGVEIPNPNPRFVALREMLECREYRGAVAASRLTFALGQDVAGRPRLPDLAEMPHLLVSGATGSGKSVLVNSIISSILYNATPDEVRFLMIDPKMVELNVYAGIPHLLRPVVTEADQAVPLLQAAVTEMKRRYRLFSELNVRNLDNYRKLREEQLKQGKTSLQNLPSIVIIIDELADLMMLAPEEIEGLICRLAQLARATGMHLVVATQRPSVDVITGIIKANLKTRISFAVASSVDSRTILDIGGAEHLMGKGDGLFLPNDAGRPERIQGAFISDKATERLIAFWREQNDTSIPLERENSLLLDVPAKIEQRQKDTEKEQSTDKHISSDETPLHVNASSLSSRLHQLDSDASQEIRQEEDIPQQVTSAETNGETHQGPIPLSLLPILTRIAQGERGRFGKEHGKGKRLSEEDLNEVRLLVAAYVFRHNGISTTRLQHHFKLGYGLASSIIEDLVAIGILNTYQENGKARRLTSNRGGQSLPKEISAVRDLVDQYFAPNEKEMVDDDESDADDEEKTVHTDELEAPSSTTLDELLSREQEE